MQNTFLPFFVPKWKLLFYLREQTGKEFLEHFLKSKINASISQKETVNKNNNQSNYSLLLW